MPDRTQFAKQMCISYRATRRPPTTVVSSTFEKQPVYRSDNDTSCLLVLQIHLRHVIASGQCKSWYDLCDTVDGTVPERRTMLQLEMSFSAQTKIVDTSKLSPKDSEFVPSESGPPIHVGRSELLEVVVRYCEEERPPPILLLSGPCASSFN